MSSSPSDPPTETVPGQPVPEPGSNEADEQTSTIAKTHARMEDLPEEHRLHDADYDARIIAKLKAQGVRIGRGMIAPPCSGPP